MSRYYTSTRFRAECPTCGSNLGQLEESYKRLQEQGQTAYESLEALKIERPCCRVHALWPIVLPLGGFYLPRHEASMLNYIGIKEQAPQPNLVILSLRRGVNGEHFLISHVDEKGFIGHVASGMRHEPTEVVIHGGNRVKFFDEAQLTGEAAIRIQTEPGEITRGFPFETRAFRRDIEVDRVKSYFDLAPEEMIKGGEEPTLDDLITADEVEADEPLVMADE